MNSLGAGKKNFKRRGTRENPCGARMPEMLDLNSFPALSGDAASASGTAQAFHGETSGVIFLDSPQGAAVPPNLGLNYSPIDVEALDDEIQMVPASIWMSSGRHQSSRNQQPVTVILDDDNETTPVPTGETVAEQAMTLLSFGMTNPRHDFFDLEEGNSTRSTDLILFIPEHENVIPKEPKFTCPICMNELEDASSTKCGHIFCEKCIKTAIQVQKKCPTCRRKLTVKNFHRVYLPTTE